jgi:hypothetical protein
VDLFYIGQAIFMVAGFIWLGVRTRSAKKPVAIEKPAATPGHTLVRTWMESDPTDRAYAGWRWKCSCGVKGASTTCTKTSLGSESNAIEQFKIHAKGYHEANFDAQKGELDKVTADFKEYRQKCFCKDTNDDLRLLDYQHSLTKKALTE